MKMKILLTLTSSIISCKSEVSTLCTIVATRSHKYTGLSMTFCEGWRRRLICWPNKVLYCTISRMVCTIACMVAWNGKIKLQKNKQIRLNRRINNETIIIIYQKQNSVIHYFFEKKITLSSKLLSAC